uniref:EH domain-containing protein 4 n=1 Tax=Sipha flava TaxID=143950 RepID=A0A2S2QER4_9HEMI
MTNVLPYCYVRCCNTLRKNPNFRKIIHRSFYKNFMKDRTSLDHLKNVYKSKLLPLEKRYLYHEFHLPPLTDQDFEAKPMVLFVGQYSTGKTSMIRYLIEKDYPGIRIGPEPTTDKFMVVMGGDKEQSIPVEEHCLEFMVH